MADESREHWPHMRARSIDSVELLLALLRDSSTDPQRLLYAYLDAKGVLASAFRVLATERLVGDLADLDKVKEAVEAQMKISFGGLLPDRYLAVRGFGGVHPLL